MKKNAKKVSFLFFATLGSLFLTSSVLSVNFANVGKNPQQVTTDAVQLANARAGTYSVTLKNDVTLFEFDAPDNFKSHKASDFDKYLIKQLIISNKEAFFDITGTVPENMFNWQSDEYLVILDPIIRHDYSGTLQFTFRLNSANDDPSASNTMLTQTILIKGLQSYINVTFKDESVFEIGDPSAFVDENNASTVESIKQLVIDNKQEILNYDRNDFANFDWQANVIIENVSADRELGTIRFVCKIGDAQKQLTISGYKKFYQMEIDYEVETSIDITNVLIPTTDDITGSQIFADDERFDASGGVFDNWIKDLIIENKDYLFNFSRSFPEDFDFSANLEIGRKYPNVNQGILDVPFTIRNATNANVEDNSLTGSIIFKGFLKKWEVKFKKPNSDNSFNFGDSRYYPDDTLNIDEEWIKNTIFRNRNTMFSETNYGMNKFNWNTDLEISSITPNRQECYLSFNLRMINTTNHTNVQTIQETIIFTGFKPLPYSISMVRNQFPFGDENAFASEIDAETLKALIIEKKDTFFSSTNVPRTFSWEDNLRIERIVQDNEAGTIKFNFSLNNSNQNGQVISKTNVLISNFKKAYKIKLKRYTFNDFFPKRVKINESDILSEDGEEWLVKQIYRYKVKMFDFVNEYPSERPWWLENLHLSNIRIIDDDKMSFDMTLNNFTDDPTESRDSIQWQINFTNLNIERIGSSSDSGSAASSQTSILWILLGVVVSSTVLALIVAIILTKSRKNKH